MIPRQLHLYNFLSYQGETELDLRGIHVACLSGDNGNGKSALLDAMTWALWGWARGRRYGQGGASPDELVYQGQTEMEISLEFEASGTVYRVTRKYSKNAKSRNAATILDLQANTGDGYRSLTVGSVGDSERQLQHLLRMDYETFVNSAFLLQGQADRFTTSKPAQRKETLADILGLSLYERLEERAKERVREQDQLLARNQIDRESVERELERRPEVEKSRAIAGKSLEAITPQLGSAKAEEDALRGRLDALQRVQREAQELRDAALRGEVEAKQHEAQAAVVKARIPGYRETLARREEIGEGVQKLATEQLRLHTFEDTQARDAELGQQSLGLEHTIAQAQQRLQHERERLDDRVLRELTPKAERVAAVETSLAEVTRELTELEGQGQGVQRQREKRDETVRLIERLESDNVRLRSEMEELRGRYDMLVEGEANCPVCGTLLGADGLAHLRQEREAQGKGMRAKFLENQQQVETLSPERTKLDAAVAELEKVLVQKQRDLAAQQGALGRELEDGRTAATELADLGPKLAALVEQLERGDFAVEEQRTLQEMKSQRTAIGYDSKAHQDARAAVRGLESFAELARGLNEAENRLPQDETALTEFEALVAARRKDVESATERLAAIAGELEGMPALQSGLMAASQERQTLESRSVELGGEIRHRTLQLEELAVKEADMATLSEGSGSLESAKTSYSVLVDAFGKRGIQALLIEAALPELEAQANDLLARLTDHRMTLALETQRQNRRGEVSETLEIRIADELGTRSYELFSGGEAFRINFALRVALAKLLASRSGAPLRTLFLDEGFGTQDPGGRERLVEAIQTIQDEFDLILVVTHIEELKEAFPARIDVSKTDMGSTLDVVWV
jgi:exonuclease SbcC